MNDLLKRAKQDPFFRKKRINKLANTSRFSVSGSVQISITKEERVSDRQRFIHGLLKFIPQQSEMRTVSKQFMVSAFEKDNEIEVSPYRGRDLDDLGSFEIEMVRYWINAIYEW